MAQATHRPRMTTPTTQPKTKAEGLKRLDQLKAEGLEVLVDSNGKLNTDGWTNILTGLGQRLRDKRMRAEFGTPTRLATNQLDLLYAGDWRVARITDRPASDQTRRWFDIEVDGRRDQADDMQAELRRLEAKPLFTDGIAWSRLYGGAICVMGINDGREAIEPLNEDAIRSINWLRVLDRGDVDIQTYYPDAPDDPRSGKPEIYQLTNRVTNPTGGVPIQKIHETRILRWDGVRTSYRRQVELSGWADSVITRVYGIIRDWATGIDSAAHLITDFAQATMTIQNLAKLLAEDKDELVIQRLQFLDLARSVARLIPLDPSESFERKQTPITGLPELLDRLRDELTGAVDMPEKILFGKATAGLGDQGQSDLEQYYNGIEGEQERNLTPQATRLVSLLYKAAGNEPDSWQVVPRPLWTPSETENSENRARDAQADQIRITSGVLAAEEVRASRYGGDAYGTELQVDPELEEDGDQSGDLDLEGFGVGLDPQTTLSGGQLQSGTAIAAKALAGEITSQAARVLLVTGLGLTEEQADEMLEGVEEAQEERSRRAAEMAARVGGNGPDQGSSSNGNNPQANPDEQGNGNPEPDPDAEDPDQEPED